MKRQGFFTQPNVMQEGILLIFMFACISVLYLLRPGRDGYEPAPTIAYYTVFCGDDSNAANSVKAPPSTHHPCFFYTNNPTTSKRAQLSGWSTRLLQWPISKDDITSANQAKTLKAKPHEFPDLALYDFTVYMDSKVVIDVEAIERVVADFDLSKCIYIKKHPFLEPNVWNEYNEALKQTRYARQATKMHAYILKQLASGLSEDAPHHYWTAFIIRNMKHSFNKRISNLWYDHIIECGIECQISFFFIAQMFQDFVIPDTSNVSVKYS